MKFKTIQKLSMFGFILLFALACANDINMTMPKGPKGDKGDSGKSAFELWKEFYGKGDQTTIDEFFASFKGKDGMKGKDGLDGKDGTNGTNGKDGEPGINGLNAYQQWVQGIKDKQVYDHDNNLYTGATTIEDYFEWLKGRDGKNGTNGTNGTNGEDGKDGTNGTNGTNGENGKDGEPGINGLNAYQQWVQGVKDKQVFDHDNNLYTGATTIENYFEWLKGRDGKNGTNGTNGTNGEDGKDGTNGTNGENGKDGADGKDGFSAYELWKEAVDKGQMNNKDGSKYTGGNSWAEYLKWLQGGDISTLHQHWILLPGNEDKTIEEFIKELFSCHCDQIELSIQTARNCVILKDGAIAGKYNAEVKIAGDKGTKVVIINSHGEQVFDQTLGEEEVFFNSPQTDEDQQFTVYYTLPKKSDTKTKEIRIPALNPTRFSIETKPVENTSGHKINVKLVFDQAIDQNTVVTVDGVRLIAGKDDWKAIEKGFEKVFEKGAEDVAYQVTINSLGQNCTESIFKIESLEKLDTPTISYENYDDCSYKVIFKGTPGMQVSATIKDQDGHETVAVKEVSSGQYELILEKDFYNNRIDVSFMKDGYGTASATLDVPREYSFTTPIYRSAIEETNQQGADKTYKFENVTDRPIELKFTRNNNYNNESMRREPWIMGNTVTYTVPANSSINVTFKKDYTHDFKRGSYRVSVTYTNMCNKIAYDYFDIQNQEKYKYGFTPLDDDKGNGNGGNDGSGSQNPGGGIGSAPGTGNGNGNSGIELEPGQSWNDDGSITDVNGEKIWKFVLTVEDAIPNVYLQLLLLHDQDLLSAVINKKTDAEGKLTGIITLKDKDYKAAVNSGKGQFIFAKDKLMQQVVHRSEIDFKIN